MGDIFRLVKFQIFFWMLVIPVTVDAGPEPTYEEKILEYPLPWVAQ